MKSTMTLRDDLPVYPTIIHAVQAAAEIAPDRDAFICADKRVTYAQFERAVGGLAHRLQEFGAQGGRVAIVMGNSIETSVAAMGGMAAGAQIALMNPMYTDHELAPLLADVDPVVILCSPPFAERLTEQAKKLGVENVIVMGEGEYALETWIDDPAMKLPEPLPKPEDKSAMFFTGGTTGLPKGAEHDHAMMELFCRLICTPWQLDFDTERILSVAPMFHIWGHHFVNIMPVYIRATTVIIPMYKPDDVLAAFEDHDITVFAGGPPVIYMGLLGSEKIGTTDFSKLKYCLSGGAACSEYLLNTWEEKTGCMLLEGGGMSEGAPVACNPTHGERRLMSIGQIPPETEIEIVDLESGDTIMPDGERGEVRIKADTFTTSYRNRPEETAETIRDGWLYTGDIGYLDDDGYLFLVDRKKEMILVGGYNVYPREVDEVLLNHDAIREAAAVAMADEFSGEVVKACVSLMPGQELSEQDIIDYCAERLVKYKIPKAVEFFEELPKTGPAKIDKLKLRGLR
ncbi:MAG: AMP-binding protein [Rhodospirillaceae bacterium]|jgi:long-chain acyl-CoA synthetase|nr:AMP-binding protein [Rhodospirillaceae bacterium]